MMIEDMSIIFDEVSANLNLHTIKTNTWIEVPTLGIAVFLSWDKKFVFIDKLQESESVTHFKENE